MKRSPLARWLAGLDAKAIITLIVSLTSLAGALKASRQADDTRADAGRARSAYQRRYAGMEDTLRQIRLHVERLERRIRSVHLTPTGRLEFYGPPEPPPRQPGVARRFFSFITRPFRGEGG